VKKTAKRFQPASTSALAACFGGCIICRITARFNCLATTGSPASWRRYCNTTGNGTALPLINGRHLLAPEAWAAWEQCIVNTVIRTAQWEGNAANWHAQLLPEGGNTKGMLMQYCHGAPGFVICLAGLQNKALDDVLVAWGEANWLAGPLTKGSNLCHGTGGNGYAFLKLYQRTGNPLWLERARAFAMHGIAQTDAAARPHGQMRYSLWTGDIGFAIYLWDCINALARFPTLDAFY
jgi:hypothetical protein